MKLGTLVEQIPGLKVAGHVDLGVEVDRVTFDSREAGPGALFVALVGARSDGHAFVDRARELGASAVLAMDGRVDSAIVCEDTRAILPQVAAAVYGNPSRALVVIGITGTNGKTTTSYLLEQVFSHARRRVGVVGTVGYRWPGHIERAANTTPESATLQRLMSQMVRADVDHVIMEVSSHGLATHRVEETLFDCVLFTNLSQDHLDFHGTMDAYRDAKGLLFSKHVRASVAAGKTCAAVINLDDDAGGMFAELAAEAGAKVVTYSTRQPADICAAGVKFGIDGTAFDLMSRVAGASGLRRVVSQLLGGFNVENILGSIGVAVALGLSLDQAVAGVARAVGPPGRMQKALDSPATFVDYAHTPDAIDSVVDTLRPLTKGRLIVVCGCGGDRDRTKRPLMAVAAMRADIAVLTSDNPRSEDPEAILADMTRGVDAAVSYEWSETGVIVCADRAAAIEMAIQNARSNDVVLIAGKGHENFQEVGEERRPFDDVKVAQAAGAK